MAGLSTFFEYIILRANLGMHTEDACLHLFARTDNSLYIFLSTCLHTGITTFDLLGSIVAGRNFFVKMLHSAVRGVGFERMYILSLCVFSTVERSCFF